VSEVAGCNHGCEWLIATRTVRGSCPTWQPCMVCPLHNYSLAPQQWRQSGQITESLRFSSLTQGVSELSRLIHIWETMASWFTFVSMFSSYLCSLIDQINRQSTCMWITLAARSKQVQISWDLFEAYIFIFDSLSK